MADHLRRPIRWGPALIILAIGAAGFFIVRSIEEWPYEQMRTNVLLGVTLCIGIAMLVWWLLFSRARVRNRFLTLVVLCLPLALFRVRGCTGDFVPIVEFRFGQKKQPLVAGGVAAPDAARPAFPQLFGPN